MASQGGAEAPSVEPAPPAPGEAPAGWTDVEEALRRDPQSFEFFQAVRLLRLARPTAGGVGEFLLPSEEGVQFSPNPKLGFPAGEIQELDLEDPDRARMEVNFMGLVGHQGVLPIHYSRMVQRQEKVGKGRPFRDFLDMFQHRLVSLFYRAWEKARFFVPFERGEADPVSSRVYDILGLGSPSLRGRMDVPDESLLFYPQLLGPRPRTAWSLKALIEDYLEVPVTVHQFVGGWYKLSKGAQCALDDDFGPSSPRLGRETIVGDEVWDPQAKVRIRLGPLPKDRYEDFLPGGQGNRALTALTSFFCNGQADFEIQLVLKQDDAPRLMLGNDEAATPLGWLTWLQTQPLSRDPDETILTIGEGRDR